MFLAPSDQRAIPPLIDLPKLLPTDIKPRVLSTSIDLDDNSASLDLALENADYFELSSAAALSIVKEVGNAVVSWREEATRFGLKSAEINRMASAFEHDDLKQAID